MSREFKKVALVGLYDDARVAEPMRLMANFLTESGVEVLALSDFADDLDAQSVSERKVPDEADLIIAVGGDGTMLYAASIAGEIDVPLLGVNRGRLGFLTDVSPLEMVESLGKILDGEYTRETRLRLSATLYCSDGSEQSALALNDVVLQRKGTARMLDCETRIGGRYVNTHMGDGLIAATPTGSTAYALSCGGPIIEPSLDAIVVVPICPHTLSDRPLVIPSNHEIEVTLLPRDDTGAVVSVDGHALGELGSGERLLIREAASRITLIHPPGYDYFQILRSKLNWGRDSRKRAQERDA